MNRTLIDYGTLKEWQDRPKNGILHGDILANLNNLIKMALIAYDNEIRVSHLESRNESLCKSIDCLQKDIQSLRFKSCKNFKCENRNC